MRNFKYLDNILSVMQDLEPEPLNEQLLLYGGDKVKRELPFDSLLSQFKYCLDNGIKNNAYKELKSLLDNICSKGIIDDVEELYHGGN